MSHLFWRRNGRNRDADDLAGTSGDPPVTPVDLAAVQADDVMLNTLGRADVARGDADAELIRVLVAWRREVDTESIGPLVDIDTAVATISAARKSDSRRHSVLRPVAAAAAVLVIAFAGLGAVAKSAHPGDQLFPLTKALYGKYARSMEAAEEARTELGKAQSALNEGDTSRARDSLEKVQVQLDVIAKEQGQESLATEHRKLEKILDGVPSVAGVDPTTESAPLTSASKVPEESVTTSEPTTAAPSPTETQPAPTTGVSTAPSPTVLVSEPTTAQTGSSSGAAPRDGEESSPPPVTSSSG